jgi:hypothetical protein
MGNTFITDLVRRDLQGEEIGPRVEAWNGQLLQVFAAFLRLYTNLYGAFGNSRVAVPKIVWDHAVYWGVNALRVIKGKLTDLEFTQKTGPDLVKAIALTTRLQGMFAEWHDLIEQQDNGGGFVCMNRIPGITELNQAPATPMDDAALEQTFHENVIFLEALAVQIFAEAVRSLPAVELDENKAINPLAVSLDPDSWEQDGLFDGTGLSIAEARSRAPGIQEALRVEPVPAG